MSYSRQMYDFVLNVVEITDKKVRLTDGKIDQWLPWFFLVVLGSNLKDIRIGDDIKVLIEE